MPNDLLNRAETAYVGMADSKYRAEQELADRYRAFVSEILRLSLAGLAVFSILYKDKLPGSDGGLGLKDYFALSGIAMFALSVASALYFLYCASERLRWYIAGLHHGSFESGASGPVDTEKNKSIDECLAERMLWIHRCRWSKLAAALLLGGGGIFVALAIIAR